MPASGRAEEVLSALKIDREAGRGKCGGAEEDRSSDGDRTGVRERGPRRGPRAGTEPGSESGDREREQNRGRERGPGTDSGDRDWGPRAGTVPGGRANIWMAWPQPVAQSSSWASLG